MNKNNKKHTPLSIQIEVGNDKILAKTQGNTKSFEIVVGSNQKNS